MRKEISVYVETAEQGEELKITSTVNPDFVVLDVYNVKIGVSLKELKDALYEVEFFKLMNKQHKDIFNNSTLVLADSEVVND